MTNYISVQFGESNETNVKMIQAKFVHFIVGVIIAFSASGGVLSTDNADTDVGIKRSAVCLIQHLAHHNHIEAKYENKSFEQRNATTSTKCKLNLGKEHYESESTSYKKCKDKVSRQAYALTNYTKPALHDRTCIIQTPTAKSDISLLHEYAQALHSYVTFEEKPHEVIATLGNLSASGTSNQTKKKAKTAAASNLIEKIGRKEIVNKLESKFNGTDFHGMDPVERLRKIIRVSDTTGDAAYAKLTQSTELKGGQRVETIIAKVEAKDSEVTGKGSTLEEAKRDAAANLLRELGFIVNYPPPKPTSN